MNCIYSLTGTVWAHPICEMADPNKCHYQRMAALNCIEHVLNIALNCIKQSVPCGSPRHACQGKICSHSTSKHGHSSDECLQTEHTSVTEPKAKKLCHQFGYRRAGVLFYNIRYVHWYYHTHTDTLRRKRLCVPVL